VRTQPARDREKLVPSIDEIEPRHADDEITGQEWEAIEWRAARLEAFIDLRLEQSWSLWRTQAV
jgi:hypothetical protein